MPSSPAGTLDSSPNASHPTTNHPTRRLGLAARVAIWAILITVVVSTLFGASGGTIGTPSIALTPGGASPHAPHLVSGPANGGLTPSLELLQGSGAVGSVATLVGWDYSPSSAVTVAWDGDQVACSGLGSGTNSNGAFSCSVSVPSASGGSHTLTASVSGDATTTAATTFVVTPSFSISSTQGNVGTQLLAQGTGYPASSSVSVVWPGIGSVCRSSSSAVGTFSCSFAVPTTGEGTYGIQANAGAEPVAPAEFTVNPQVTLSEPSVLVGATVVAQGTGFPAGKSVSVAWAAGVTACSSVASASGSFSCTFNVPATTFGDHQLAVSVPGASSVLSVGATLSVGTSLSVSTASTTVGSAVTVSGLGLPAGSIYTVLWDWAPVACSTASATTTETGSFSCTLTVPQTVSGSHTISVSTPEGTTAPTTTISVAPSLSLSESQAAVGTSIVLTGTGFWENARVGATFGPSGTDLCNEVTASGGFSCLFMVPAGYAGAHTITVRDLSTDGRSNAPLTTSLTIVPALELAPGSGPSGSNLTITGTGFAAVSTVSIAWDGTPLSCASSLFSTDALGTFACTAIAPVSNVGSHVVTAVDSATPVDTAQATFWVVPASGGSDGARPFASCNSGCSISLSTSSGPVGTSVTVTGSSFAASSTVSVTWSPNSMALCSATATSAGAFSCSFLAPPAVAGSHTVTAADNHVPSDFTTASFTITPNVFLTVGSGIVGSSSAANGSGFAASSTITVTWSPGSITICTTTSNATGSFLCNFQVPSDVAGTHTVTGTDGTNSAAASYTVQPNLSLSQSSGAVGTLLTVTGSGFAGSSTITVDFGSSTETCSQGNPLSSSSRGAFNCTFTVPAAVIGAHTITATDASSNSASVTFTIISTISLSPDSGRVGTSVTVTGNGFAGNSAMTGTWAPSGSPTFCTSTTSSATGSFSCMFTVPAAVEGNHTVTLIDASTNTATANFNVTSFVSLSPTSGIVGSTTVVTGTGFAGSSAISFAFDDTTNLPCSSGSITSSPVGSFSCSTVTIPTADQGGHAISATDAASNSASAPFTVEPSLSVSPTSGTVGSTVTVSGNGYTTGATITSVAWNALSTIDCTGASSVSSSGTWSCQFVVPNTGQGTYVISAFESTGSPSDALTSYTVEPALSISPSPATYGENPTATATGFGGGATVTITVTWTSGAVSCTGTASAYGLYSCALPVRWTVAGTYTVSASDNVGNSATTTIVIDPSIVLVPVSGPVGTTVTVEGASFAASSAISVGWTPSGSYCLTVLTNSTGNFTCTFGVPGAVAGAHTVTATDGAHNSATATFTVTAQISLDITGGVVGTAVTATGTGYAGAAAITVTLDASSGNLALCHVTSNAVGNWSCTFSVPPAYEGNHAIVGSDGTNSASELFLVEPSLYDNPSNGVVGSTFTVTGTGYGSNVGITVYVYWFSGTAICSATTTGVGNLTGCLFTVPVTPGGFYGDTLIYGVDSSPNASYAYAFFSVDSQIELFPTGGYVSETFEVYGTGFDPFATVSLSWDVSQPLTCTGGYSCSSGTVTSGLDGDFLATFSVPPATRGNHLVNATDGFAWANATFDVFTDLVVTSPVSFMGVVGSSVTVLGNGFAPNSAVTVLFSSANEITVCTGSTNLTGAFTCSFSVPLAAAGYHNVVATDASNNFGGTSFDVLPSVILSPGSGIVGTSVLVTGYGFDASGTASVDWSPSGTLCASASTNATGDFSCTFTVPAAYEGAHTVTATDNLADSASATFTVNPSITLTPTSGIVGSTVGVTGTGFTAGVGYFLDWDAVNFLGCSGSFPTDPTGGFNCSFAVPASVTGTHTVTAEDYDGYTASATFTVLSSLTLYPTSGVVGTSVIANGTGFASISPITVTWSPGGATLCTASSSSLGSFSCTFTVPHATFGAHTVTAEDGALTTATATFTVNPSLTLTPATGIVGTSVTVTGAGFPAASTYTVAFAGNVVTCTPTGSTSAVGDFSCTITVPAAVAGNNPVVGIAGGDLASAFFDVQSAITLSPNSGNVRDPSTVTGTGFAGLSPITTTYDGSTIPCSGASSTNSVGGFTCTFTIPQSVEGLHTVTVTDGSLNSASATYTVIPDIFLGVGSGIVGQNVALEGQGFAASTTTVVTWLTGGLVLCPSSVGTDTNSVGTFFCSFVVPPATGGAHTIQAVDGASNSATVTFTVDASLALTPSSGIVDSTSTATGNGFGGTDTASVAWTPGSVALCSTLTNATGYFSCTFTVPAAVEGAHTVTATDPLPSTATATYTVDSNLVLTPSSGLVGSTTTASGTGFAGTSSIDLVWDVPATTLTCTSGTLLTSSVGSFTCAFTIPASSIGAHTVTATDASHNSASAIFTVGPYVVVTPTSGEAMGYGIVGTAVTASGAGFTAGDVVTVTWTPGTLCSGTANAVGSFSCTTVIPATPGAQYTLTATDQHANSATTLLTVVPAVNGAPNGERVGGVIWVNGTGFYAAESVDVVWTPAGSTGYSICPSTMTEANGSFTCGPFTIPREAAGPVDIVVFDQGLQANFTYTITTNLTVAISVSAPASEPPTDVGVPITFSASASLGFTPYASYTWNFGDGSTATTTGTTTTHAYASPSGPSGYTATVTVTDAVGSTASSSMTIVVYADPSATTPAPSRTSADVGQTVQFTTTESGGIPGGITYSWSGLPSGCSGTTTATVTCSDLPTAGTLSISVTVTDAPSQSIDLSYTSGVLLFTVYADPAVTLTVGPSSTDVGQTMTFTASVTGGSGGATYAWSGLPAGCPANPTTATVVCTASAAGSTSVTVHVVDSNGVSAASTSVPYTVFADPALPAPSASVNSADVGQSVTFSDTPTSTGAGSLVWAWFGLPVGCGGSTGTVACNPSTPGTYSVSARITDANGFSVTSLALSFTVYADPAVTVTSSVPSADVDQSVTFTASVSGGSGGLSYMWSGLPAGCPASPTGDSVTCPSLTGVGTSFVTASVTDSNHASATSPSLSFVVNADPTIVVSASPSSADVGQTVTFSATASLGSGGFTFAWTGLPAGCPASPTVAVVQCTTTTAASGTVGVTATDTDHGSASSSLAYTVSSDPTISLSESRASADGGQVATFTATAGDGSGGYTYAWSGLPTGCSGTTAMLSCVAPTTVTTSASFVVTVTVTDSNGMAVTSGSVTLTVYADPTVSLSASRVAADIGQAATYQAVAALGSGGDTYSWSGLPATGCAGTSTADVSCTLASTGTYSISVSVTDTDGFLVTSSTVSLTVSDDPTVGNAASSAPSADVGQGVTFAVTTTPGSGGDTITWNGLPGGCGSSTLATDTCVALTTAGTYSVTATLVDSNGFSVTSAAALSFTVYADPVPATPTSSVATADVGQAVTFAASATLGSGSDVYSWSGLPTGCPTGATTASVACSSVTASGTYSVSASVTDSNGGSGHSIALSFVVYADPSVGTLSASRSSVDVGQTVAFTVTASSGSGGYTYAWSGLPTGCTGTSATISCAPTASGTSTVSVVAKDSNGITATSNGLPYTVDSDPTVATPSASVASADVGQTVTFAANPSGGSGGYAFAWSNLPSGCPSTVVGGSVTCTIGGAGTYSVTVTVTDSNGASVTSTALSFTTKADPVPTTPSPSVASADVGQAVTFTSSATLGTGTYTWAWSGLPTGCPTTGTTLSVVCTSVTASGTYSVKATVTDTNGFTVGSQSLSFVVYADPTVSTLSASRSSVDVGQTVAFTVTASSGSGGYTYAWSNLPGGCVGSTATVSCTPSAAGTASVSVTVKDSNGVSVTSNGLPYTVDTDPSAGTPSASVTSADIGQAVTFGASASGGAGGYSFAWSGLPTGCPLPVSGDSVVCNVGESGTFTVGVTVTDSNGASSTSPTLSFQVFNDPTVSTPKASATTADDGQAVTFTVTAGAGSGGYTYAWSGLPSGCTGTTTAATSCTVATGPLSISATVTDSNGFAVSSGTLAYTVYTDPVAAPPTANRTTADAGQKVTFGVTASGGSGGYTFAWSGLPSTCASTTDSIACVLSGSVSVSVQVTDSNGGTSTSPVLAYTVYPDPVVATPVANRTSLDAGQSVAFSSALTVAGAGGDTFFWASSSTEFVCAVSATLGVTCQALAAGTYTVTLTATDSNFGIGTSTSVALTALPDPTATAPAFAPNATFDVATGESASVTATGGAGHFTYTWMGLPNGCTGTSADIQCTPAASGTFSVWVWIVDGNGFGFASPAQAITVNPQLEISLAGNRATSTVGLAVVLEANLTGGTAPFTYFWSFGDGATGSGPVASHEYSSAGTYTVWLYVNDSGGSHVVKDWVVSVGPKPEVLGVLQPNVDQLELVAALIIVGLLVVAVAILLMRRRRVMGTGSPAAPPAGASPSATATAPTPAAKPATASKTNIDETLAELEAISKDGSVSEP